MRKIYEENWLYHVTKRFDERFNEEDFVINSKKYGIVDFKKEVVDAMVNAPKTGIRVNGGKGFREIFKIRIANTKAVFVVWDMKFSIPITVLTGELWSKTCANS